jgi:hypothetical protein
MSDKHEATVEVLTAEVRVLQVGRRQVTLSVVRQLDWANPADVVPFGRVRTGDTLPGARPGDRQQRVKQCQVGRLRHGSWWPAEHDTRVPASGG